MSRRVGLGSRAGVRNPVAVGVAGVTCRSAEAGHGVLLGVRVGVGVAVLVALVVAVAVVDSAGSPQADGVAVAVAAAAADGLGDGLGDDGAAALACLRDSWGGAPAASHKAHQAGHRDTFEPQRVELGLSCGNCVG